MSVYDAKFDRGFTDGQADEFRGLPAPEGLLKGPEADPYVQDYHAGRRAFRQGTRLSVFSASEPPKPRVVRYARIRAARPPR